MKIKLYKRPGKNKKLINEMKIIIDELTGIWFTKHVGQSFYIELHYQDVFVLYNKNKVKSFIIFTCIDGCITMTLFATNNEDRNKGYGSILYKSFEKYCIKNGFKRFLLQTKPPEKFQNYNSTISFYEKHGYKVTKVYKELWENGAIQMEKEYK
jgi:ribosomal protein S18 acetylase RimI-like enzyme